MYTQLNDQTVLFQTIQFIVSHLFVLSLNVKNSIWPIDRNLPGATTPGWVTFSYWPFYMDICVVWPALTYKNSARTQGAFWKTFRVRWMVGMGEERERERERGRDSGKALLAAQIDNDDSAQVAHRTVIKTLTFKVLRRITGFIPFERVLVRNWT